MGDRIVVGDVDWMRNDYLSNITVGKWTFPSVEHAYQAAKFKDGSVKDEIAEADDVRAARKIGRNRDGMRDDWDTHRSTIMESLVRQKFTNDAILSDRLAKTGSADIVMEGYDEYWGTGRTGYGENTLGTILETVRSEIQFINGVDPEEYDSKDEDDEDDADTSLSYAIMNDPGSDLANACQKMYVGAKALMTLVDPNDFDVDFIVRRTGVGESVARDAIEKLQSMQSALNTIKDLVEGPTVGVLSTVDDDDEDDEDDDDGDMETDHPSDDWLNPMD